MPDIHRNFIGGEWVAGATATANRNPSDVREVIGEYAQADAAGTRAAIAAAKQAFPGWAAGSLQERANLLDRVGTEVLARKDELGRLLSREEGRRCPKAWARPRARGTSSSSSRAKRCASPATRWRRCGPASTSR